MNVLICYPWLELGGAPNTAITIARGLKERGHDVFFFSHSGGMYGDRLEEAGIPLITAPHSTFLPHLYHLNMGAYRELCRALDRYSIDVVHAFHPNPYYLALFAAPGRKIPVVLTMLWFGRDFRFPYYPGRVVFVAEEFKDYLEPRFSGSAREMQVVANRIDLDMFKPGVDYGDFAARMGLPGSRCRIVFMSRIDSMKVGSLRHAIEAMRILSSNGVDAVLAIAGDGSHVGEISSLADDVNRETGRTVVMMLGKIVETPQLLSWADLVFGVGRCAWEGMACGKPTFVVGENGLAGVVGPDTVEELAYYNFAGRNVRAPVSPDLLANEVEGLVTDPARRDSLARFARDHVIENLDFRVGAERMEEIYERAITDPPLSGLDRFRVFLSNSMEGLGFQAYMIARSKVRTILRRG